MYPDPGGVLKEEWKDSYYKWTGLNQHSLAGPGFSGWSVGDKYKSAWVAWSSWSPGKGGSCPSPAPVFPDTITRPQILRLAVD